jgi:hypothetical protein
MTSWKGVDAFNNRSFQDNEMTDYEKEIKELCRRIRQARSIEDSMKIFCNWQYYDEYQ